MRPDVRYHAICGVFKRLDVRYHAICGVFKRPDVYHAICGVFRRPDVRYHAICGVFRRPGRPRRTIRLCYKKSTFQPRKLRVCAAYYVSTTKSRLSSHGSSGRPRRTIRLCYKKSTFQLRKLRVCAAYYVCTTKVDFPATEAPGVPGVLYVCTTKVDFPATEAPRGVLRLYYKSRLSSHGSSGRPLRTTFVLQNSIFQPRKSPAYYVCTTQVEKQTQKHYGFSTATTRKPAEGLRLHVKKRKNTRVSAPRQRRKPQRGYVCMSKNAKTPRFWHRANAETRRGLSAATKKSTKNDGFSTATRRSPAEGCPRPQRNVKKRRFWHRDHAETRRGLSAQIKKRKKTTVFAPRPRRNPQRVAIPIGDVNPARRLRKSNFNLEI